MNIYKKSSAMLLLVTFSFLFYAFTSPLPIDEKTAKSRSANKKALLNPPEHMAIDHYNAIAEIGIYPAAWNTTGDLSLTNLHDKYGFRKILIDGWTGAENIAEYTHARQAGFLPSEIYVNLSGKDPANLTAACSTYSNISYNGNIESVTHFFYDEACETGNLTQSNLQSIETTILTYNSSAQLLYTSFRVNQETTFYWEDYFMSYSNSIGNIACTYYRWEENNPYQTIYPDSAWNLFSYYYQSRFTTVFLHGNYTQTFQLGRSLSSLISIIPGKALWGYFGDSPAWNVATIDNFCYAASQAGYLQAVDAAEEKK